MQSMEVRSTLVLTILMVVSLLAHAAVWAVLGLLPSVADMLESEVTTVTMEMIEPDPEPELPEPEVEEEVEEEVEPDLPEPEPEPVVRERPTEPDPPEPEVPDEPPPAEEAIADFTGETLTNDDGPATFVSAVGNGGVMEGPIGQPGAQVTGRRRTGVPGGVPGGRGTADEGPRVVAASDLSQRPGPPGNLAQLLRDMYPQRLQNLGVEGDATIRIRVSPNGTVRPLAVVRSDEAEFGQACRELMRRSGRWDPPLDRNGNAVTTITTFRCRFTISF